MTDHDHDAETAQWGECLTCARGGRPIAPGPHVEQPSMFPDVTVPTPTPDFDGDTYRRDRDHARLGAQLGRVADALSDRSWWTLAGLAAATGDPEASVSARIRDLRKGKFGGYSVDARNTGGGRWEYRLVPAPVAADA